MARIAVCFLVDPRGHVLLQHRDGEAPRAPNLWGMVGGHVEDGEDFDAAMLRELHEETGITAHPRDLVLWQDTDYRYSDGHGGHYHVYCGRVDLTDDDIVVGEGQAIVFVDPERARALPMAESAAHFLPLFLDSDLYRRLTTNDLEVNPMPKAPLRRIELPSHGPEDVVVDGDGAVWTGTEDGCIYRVSREGEVRWVANTGGRPLGLELFGDDRVLVADADKGLLALDKGTGLLDTLATEVGGCRMRLCNNAAVAANGDIWFSDSSTVYPLSRWKADFVEDTGTGRLLCRRADGTVEVRLEGLRFANGVALAPDESFVCVAESVARTVVRLWLTGPRAGTRDLLVGDLPGYPDNIALGSDGLIWVTIASPLDPLVERIRERAPLVVRKTVARIPERLQPSPKRTARVQAYDVEGGLVHDVDADATSYHMVTGVREHQGRVWFGSLEEDAIGVVDVSEVSSPPRV